MLNMNNFMMNDNIFKNEIKIIIKVNNNDIGGSLRNKIIKYFYHEEKKPELYINGIKYDFNEYFDFQKEGEYNVTFKFSYKMTDCIELFSECKKYY